MGTVINESIDIKAKAADIFKFVHDGALDGLGWTKYVSKIEAVGGKPGPGGKWCLRYTVAMPGKSITFDSLHEVWKPGVECSGTIVDGPIKGSPWSWKYSEKNGTTTVSYTMDVHVGGILRFAGGMIADQYAASFRENLRNLKQAMEKKSPARKPATAGSSR